MYNFDILSIKEQIKYLRLLENSLYKKLNQKIQEYVSFPVEILKTKNLTCLLIHIFKYKILIKNIDDVLKIGIISESDYTKSIFIKEMSVTVNDDIKLIYSCNSCDIEDDIDIYFKEECTKCKYVFYDLYCKNHEKYIKNILDMDLREEDDIKQIVPFMKELELFFRYNILKMIK